MTIVFHDTKLHHQRIAWLVIHKTFFLQKADKEQFLF